MVYELERVCNGLSMQHASDIRWCSTAVTVVAQTSYFVGASHIDRKPMK